MIKEIILLISTVVFTTSCTTSFDFDEAEQLLSNIEKDGRIFLLICNQERITINGREYLQSKNISKEEFNSFLIQFRKTNACSLQYNESKAYFITDSFLDNSKGYVYSEENLLNSININSDDFFLHDGGIKILDKVKSYWYNATSWH